MEMKSIVASAMCMLVSIACSGNTGEFSMYGHDVRSGKGRVEKWLKKIGF